MVQLHLRTRLWVLALPLLLVLLTAGATGHAVDVDLFTKVLGPFATEEGAFRGGSWADYDGDGDPDLFVPRNMDHPGSAPWNNLLYRNDTADGVASFTNVNAGGVLLDDPNSHSKTGLWGDYDNDGDLDLFVANERSQQDLLYENDGGGGFARITNGTELVTRTQSTHAAAWGDCNQDGLLDIGMDYTSSSDSLYINRLDGFPGNDSFTAMPLSGADGGGHSMHWVDVDEDGDQDFYISSTRGSRLYLNAGDCDLTRRKNHPLFAHSGIPLKANWGDYDGDGKLDVFVARAGVGVVVDNVLYRNNGKGDFTRVTEGNVVTDGGCSHQGAWGDYDNDGDLDLAVANLGFPDGEKNYLYENQGDGTFERVDNGILVNDVEASSGISWEDYDGDGFLDAFVANGVAGRPSTHTNSLYHNESKRNGNTNRWIKVRCQGTESNHSAFGTLVRVKAVLHGTARWQLRDIASRTTSPLYAHFGLADATKVDTLRVEWPSGIVLEMHDLAVDQFLPVIIEPQREEAPVAAFTVTTPVDGSVHFDAGASVAPVGTLVSYEWDFEDGTHGEGVVAEHDYESGGRYLVKLTVLSDSGVGHTTRKLVTVPCPSGNLGAWQVADVGASAFPGSARLEDAGDGEALHLCAGGSLLGETNAARDGFVMVHQELRGDFVVTARFATPADNMSGDTVGVLFRETLAEDSAFAGVFMTSETNLFQFRYRAEAGGRGRTKSGENFVAGMPGWLRIERRGNEFTGSSSLDGQEWSVVSTREIELPETLLGGIGAVRYDAPPRLPGFAALEAVVTDIAVTSLSAPAFLRGDCDGDGDACSGVNDALTLLRWLFGGDKRPSCVAACDADGNGEAELTDAVYGLEYCFQGNAPPVAPFPACGPGTPADVALGCETPSC